MEECGRENERCAYDFYVAAGYAFFDEQEDRTILDTVRRADNSMYSVKRALKMQDNGVSGTVKV